MKIHIAWLIPAGILGVLVHSYTSGTMFEDTAAESARTYHAYRSCIERSSCIMTPQDWIDYYDLKRRLEEKEIER